MKPLVVFGDPEDAVIGYLLGRWDGRPEPYAPATCDNAFPDTTLADGTTHVQVVLDGVPGAGYPMVEAATVRVTCWSSPTRPTDAKSVATRCQAFLYTHPGDDDVRSVQPLTGRLKGRDPDTENHFVTLTARVNMRPRPLT